MKNLKIKRLSTSILSAIMLGSFVLCPSASSEEKIEKLLLNDIEKKNPRYSYLINDEYEKQFTEEDYDMYVKLIDGIFNREYFIPMSEDDESNIKVCKALYNSIYYDALNLLMYDEDTNNAIFSFIYNDYEEQDEMFKYVEKEMKRIYRELFEDDMNFLDKLIMLYGYGSDNFGYPLYYPKQFIRDDGTLLKIPQSYLLKYNTGVCHSYSYFLDYFCQLEGRESFLITGKTNNTSHMWNMIKLDNGKYYFFDITTAILRGKLLNQKFVCFGMTNAEYKMYDYSIPKENMIEPLKKDGVSSLKELRNINSYKYLGNQYDYVIENISTSEGYLLKYYLYQVHGGVRYVYNEVYPSGSIVFYGITINYLNEEIVDSSLEVEVQFDSLFGKGISNVESYLIVKSDEMSQYNYIYYTSVDYIDGVYVFKFDQTDLGIDHYYQFYIDLDDGSSTSVYSNNI